MTTSFPELVIGGVLIAPFVRDVVLAGLLLLVLSPVLRLAGFDRLFSHPPAATLGLFTIILAVIVVLT